MTKRQSFSPMRRLRIFESASGVCSLCGLKIKAGAGQADRWSDTVARPASISPREVALSRELHRLSLVIESAVRTADPGNRPAIVALIDENRAFVAALSPAQKGEVG